MVKIKKLNLKITTVHYEIMLMMYYVLIIVMKVIYKLYISCKISYTNLCILKLHKPVYSDHSLNRQLIKVTTE